MKREEIIKRAFELVIEFLSGYDNPDQKIVEYFSPENLKRKLQLTLPEQGSADKMFTVLEQYLRHCVHTGHKQYYNQLWGGFSLPGVIGDLFTSLTNSSMSNYEIAPVATLMEVELMRELSALIGYPAGEGIFVTGGSNANMVALMAARNKYHPQIKSGGMNAALDRDLVLFISDQAHYSFSKAANILGIGESNVIPVKSDSEGRMLPQALESEIEKSLQKGKQPFFIGATCGTTIRAAFDPVEDLAAIAKKYKLWLHIDAAYGGSFLISKKHKHLLVGSELSDSFTWDLHKMLGAPLTASLIFMKQPGTLYSTSSSGGTEYMFHGTDTADHDLGSKSLQCARHIDVLKVWTMWQYYGWEGFERRVDHLMDLAAYAEEFIARHPRLELLTTRPSVNLCFRMKPAAPHANIDNFNLKLRDKLYKNGLAMINYTNLDGKLIALRLMLVNADLDFDDLDCFFDKLLKTAEII